MDSRTEPAIADLDGRNASRTEVPVAHTAADELLSAALGPATALNVHFGARRERQRGTIRVVKTGLETVSFLRAEVAPALRGTRWPRWRQHQHAAP